MNDTFDISSLYKGSSDKPDEILEEVIIARAVNGGTGGTLTLPDKYVWTDFERIEFSGGAAGRTSYNTAIVPKEHIANNPTDWLAEIRYSDGETYIYSRAFATSENTILIQGNNIAWMKGYTKRYATRNLSKIISVNNGAPIGVNQRYEIDIVTELGADYVGKDLIVQAEISASGAAFTGYGEQPLGQIYTGAITESWGLKAEVEDGKIVVYTAGFGSTASPINSSLIYAATTNKWDISIGISSAPCRVKVWKIDQYITPVNSGSGYSKVSIYDGEPITDESSFDTTVSIDTFDELEFLLDVSVGSFRGRHTVKIDPKNFVNTGDNPNQQALFSASNDNLNAEWHSRITKNTDTNFTINRQKVGSAQCTIIDVKGITH